MTDADFITALERCTLPESEFTHAAHVRAAYLYLRDGSFGQAIDRMAATIRRYATSLGKPDRYHDTITVGFLALDPRTDLRERRVRRLDGVCRREPRSAGSRAVAASLPPGSAAIAACAAGVRAAAGGR